MNRALLMFVTATSLCAQNAVQGPRVGWVYESASESVRSVLGIPGSSLLGERRDAAHAAIAGNRGFAIALAGESRQPSLVMLDSGESRMLDLPAGAERAVFNASGTAAAVLYRNSANLIVVKGFPASPAVARHIDFAAAGMPFSIALSDDADAILAVYESTVTAFDEEGNRWNLNFDGAPRQVSFLDGSRDALISSEAGVYLVRTTTGNASYKKLWSGNATSAAATADGRRAIVLDGANSLVFLNLADETVSSVDCGGCLANTLSRMSDAVFRVNELSDGPLWLVDLNGQEPRAVFVPADVKSEQ
ncbi:MAG TPA: hypothetical protein VM120_09955 [Bryobacteraceae bacterium]|nr:hypothetical protein [Bryobacteraceae bacterium]